MGAACLCLAVLKAAAEVVYTIHSLKHVLRLAVSTGSLPLLQASPVYPAYTGPAATAWPGRRRYERAGGGDCTGRACRRAARSAAARSDCWLEMSRVVEACCGDWVLRIGWSSTWRVAAQRASSSQQSRSRVQRGYSRGANASLTSSSSTQGEARGPAELDCPRDPGCDLHSCADVLVHSVDPATRRYQMPARGSIQPF